MAKLWRLCRMRHYGLAMERRKRFGVSFIFKSLEQGPTFRSLLPKYPTGDPDYRILKRQRSPCTHYFYIRDEVLGPMALCVGSPLSNHRFHPRSISSIRREGVRFRKDDNGFLWTENPPALQASADRRSPEVIRQRLDYGTLVRGPKFSKKDRSAAIRWRREYFASTGACAASCTVCGKSSTTAILYGASTARAW